MIVNIWQISETNYTEEMSTGYGIEIESVEEFAAKVHGELDGNILRTEWGNGEGFDEFEIEIVEE